VAGSLGAERKRSSAEKSLKGQRTRSISLQVCFQAKSSIREQTGSHRANRRSDAGSGKDLFLIRLVREHFSEE
jgi:hypothetical protein